MYAFDYSPYPRQAAETVSDRGFVHGADGVVAGHQYSLLGRVMFETGSWVGVTDVERIATHQTPTAVGAAQIAELKEHSSLPVIVSTDAEYATEVALDQADERTQLLICLRGNRKLFRAAEPKPENSPRRQPQHGEKIQPMGEAPA